MSYDIYMTHADGIRCQVPHHMGGGTTIVGGYTEAWLNVTYNYSPFYYSFLDKENGIRWLYGKTGREVLAKLRLAIRSLALMEWTPYKDYWAPTPGNALQPLLAFKRWANMHPDAVFSGD